MIFRSATGDDLSGIRAVSLATGQPEDGSGADADYVALLRATGTVLVAAEPGGDVTGWGATKTTAHGSILTDLFVSPHQQGLGIGGELLGALWPDQPDGHEARFTFSSQHASALPLYIRAGLIPSWPLLYLSGQTSRLRPDVLTSNVLTATRVDGAVGAQAESQLTGVDRASDYEYWTRRHPRGGILVHHRERLVAVGAGGNGELSHLVCSRGHDAAPALVAALRTLDSERVTLCLPGPHPALVTLLQAGFRIDEYDISMGTAAVRLPVTWTYSPGLG